MKDKIKKITYVSIILTILVVIALIIAMVVNINSMYSEYKEQAIKAQDIITNQEDYALVEDYEEASSSIGETIEETSEEVDKKETDIVDSTSESVKTTAEEVRTENIQEKVIPDPTFVKPVEGEIIKGYSKENLVYSETLKEWTTHTGIDIQAEMTTVVKAATEGTVKYIKNDPRYGITVIIEHVNGYETRYSNLLTAEFVTVGEEVLQGQTIGTVGNTSSFEVLDEPHLHFELLKDSQYLDPTLYIEF